MSSTNTLMFSTKLMDALLNAQHVAVLTGAGMSAESGIPTFRDAQSGLWEKFKPEELANVSALLKNPVLVQAWYAWRKQICLEKRPNAGHVALVALEKYAPNFTLITQNVDRLHHRAGSQHVLELHGNIMRNYCLRCNQDATDAELAVTGEGKAAHCTHCGGLIRPDVVWFGEMLPPDTLDQAQQAAIHADVFFSIGTSAVVYPAAELPLIARDHGAYVVEINIEESAIAPYLNEVILGKSGEVLPKLLDALAEYKR